MYQSKKPYLYGTGRRKSSVARVHLFPNGTGSITINGRDIDDYFDVPSDWIARVLDYCDKFDNNYLFQSKDPIRF